MQAKTSQTHGDRLGEARRAFQRWRRGCCRPGRIPTQLWVLAAQAAADHGLAETAGQLQVSAARLEQWVGRLGLIRGPAESAATDFVELPPVPWGSPGECLVEVEDPSGRRLRISLKGSAVAQLTSVLPALCSKDPAP
jgi:hypothetical protein